MADETSPFAALGQTDIERLASLLKSAPLDVSTFGVGGPLGSAAFQTSSPDSIDPEWVNKHLSARTQMGLLGLTGGINHNSGNYGDSYNLTAGASAGIPIGDMATIAPLVEVGSHRNVTGEGDTGWHNDRTKVGAELSVPVGNGGVSVSASKPRGGSAGYRVDGSIPAFGGTVSLGGTLDRENEAKQRRMAAALTYSLGF